MLTPEQIKSLKKGDKLLVEAYFVREKDGYHIKCSLTPPYSYVSMPFSVISNLLHLPSEKPKYDPYRLFKKGDIVEMDTHGRDIAASMKKIGVELGERYTVTEDENNMGYVSFIGADGIEHYTMFFWLKLVTPVEELEKWHVYHDKDVSAFEVKTENHMETASIIFYGPGIRTEKEAEKAAESERDRLNVEWRKEQQK